ncbi:UDP-3-O-(3-hydroxymyristoyl)glucosamine N-acyltransferase [Thalassotalea sp. M1531]|uniref:UDP-3-O-acylglucosamine N-acyltransferase n=1 Tax=Thalassotalea algicola TaxID=2716224 RepID=A0A7Y0LEV1_9GAMM|nr:UDP-3-O-(3-hydroxymyristoyl)glucosamine N-acyltransferase [Thalassotalea algicola]NMP33253.1 UDP-3-O-(3-hydroxymyristoyl)glucosamine N-acyltransferase [Thalassotalea algicola]
MSYTLTDIAKHIGATVKGDGNITVSSLATLAAAKNTQIAFLANSKYQNQLKDTLAGAVIVSPDMVEHCPTNALVMDNPYMGYAMTAQLLDSTPLPAVNIHPSAIVDETAQLGNNVAIGANAVIEAGAILADDVVIGAGCFIGKNAQIGAHTKLWANISVYHECIIGERCLIQANTVIGSDGFGYAPHDGRWHKIPQLGRVIIGERVEIGASTTIDRGALEDTIIGDGCILDNQIQIAHNVVIGENTAMAACSVIAGSSRVGKNCTIAGLVGVNGHIEIADNVVLTGMTMVTKALDKPGVYSSGIPAQPNKDWNRMNARLRKLDDTTKKVSQIEKALNEAKKEY